MEQTLSVFDEPVAAGSEWTEDGFAAWLAPHWAAMAGLAQRMSPGGEAEDVLQEALGSAWAHRAQFDPGRGAPRSWLLAIVANHARRSWRRPSDPAGRPASPPRAGQGDDGDRLDLRAAISQLGDRQRLAVELYYFLDLPVAEVAEVMSCSTGTVKSTLADARRRLSTSLGEAYP